MNCYLRPKLLCLTALLVVSVLSGPAMAQEVEEMEGTGAANSGPTGRLIFGVEGWIAQPAGLDYSPATAEDFRTGGIESRRLTMNHGTNSELRYQVGYRLPGDWGKVVYSSYTHHDEEILDMFDPGSFTFGESLTFVDFAGFNNDGLADAFLSSSSTRLRDLHLNYFRPLFKSEHVQGNLILGWRRVDHDRNVGAEYFGLVPDLPPVFPPNSPAVDGLLPLSDDARVRSEFEGRGPEVGLNVEFPLLQGALVIEASAAMTVMRGKTNSTYSATNSMYLLDGVLLDPPYDIFETITVDSGTGALIPNISQAILPVALRSSSESATSQAMDIAIGFRWQALPWLDVTGGFRSSRFTDIGIDLRPGILDSGLSDVTKVSRSATYEGFYAGVVIRAF